MARVNNTQAYTTCPLFQTKPTHLKYRPTLIYGTNASDILLRRVYNLYLPYYLSLSIKQTRLPFPIHNNCSICPKVKQTRLPFPLSTIKSHSPFNLLHCDIWGPHKTPTHFGKRFFLTIVDDYTRCTWLFLMNHKSKTQHLLESFITFAQNQFQASIKTIRVDNGLEFISMYDFFSIKGYGYQSYRRILILIGSLF